MQTEQLPEAHPGPQGTEQQGEVARVVVARGGKKVRLLGSRQRVDAAPRIPTVAEEPPDPCGGVWKLEPFLERLVEDGADRRHGLPHQVPALPVGEQLRNQRPDIVARDGGERLVPEAGIHVELEHPAIPGDRALPEAGECGIRGEPALGGLPEGHQRRLR